MATYAYARVSSRDQNLTRQFDAFLTWGVDQNSIFADKKSGKDFERKSYRRLIRKLRKGDLLIIKSIDRLGRNYSAIIDEWNLITNKIGAHILVLDMPLLDTRDKSDSLVGKFISDVVLQVLSFVAENERTNIRERQREGIVAAKKKGVRFGRPNKVYSDEFVAIIRRFQNKQISIEQAAALLHLKKSNLYYHKAKLQDLGFINKDTI